MDEKIRIRADFIKAALLRQALLRQKVSGPSAAQASEPSGSGKQGLENDSDDTNGQPQTKKLKGTKEVSEDIGMEMG